MSDDFALFDHHFRAMHQLYAGRGAYGLISLFSRGVQRGSPLPPTYVPGRPKNCYENAAKAVMYGAPGNVVYVEGVAMFKSVPLLLNHAWLYNRDTQQVIDLTWNDAPDCLYRGIEVPTELLCSTLLRRTFYGLLDPFDQQFADEFIALQEHTK